MNLGFSAATTATLAEVRLEVVRRGTEEVLQHVELKDIARRIAEIRSKIPAGNPPFPSGNLTALVI